MGDRRTILAIVMALLVFFGWDAYMRGKYPDRYAETQDTEQVEQGPLAAVDEPGTQPAPVEVPEPVAAEPEVRPARDVPFEACGIEGHWNTGSGTLRDATLVEHQAPYDVTPLYAWVWDSVRGRGGPWDPYGGEPGHEQLLTDHARVLGMGAGELTSRSPFVEVIDRSAGEIALRGRTVTGIEVTRFVRQEEGTPCTLSVTTTWRNIGSTPYTGSLWLQLHDTMPEKAGRWENLVQPFAMIDGKYKKPKLKKVEGTEHYEGPVDWMALSDRYFTLVLLPEGDAAAGELHVSRLDNGEGEGQVFGGLHYVVPGDLAPGEAHTESFRMYVGPKDLATLRTVHDGLPRLVNLGIFSFFGKILLALLKFFHGFVGQWGLAIMLLTVFVKLLFFPLTQAAFKSSQAMSALQPELQGIREKFSDNPEEMNRRTMELFRERGVNPLGGCLPMLIQFPVWIALYQVLLNSVELYHTEFLYLRDLSSVDPYGALPAVVVVLMLVQQQFMPTGNMDPTQARMMKLMPLLFGFFFFTFPSGLVVYIFVNMVLTILQQWVIRRTYQQPVPAAAAT